MGSGWSSLAGGAAATAAAPPFDGMVAPSPSTSDEEFSQGCNKRQRRFNSEDPQVQLIPCLPDEIALQILARATRDQHHVMRLVCRSWNEVMHSDEIFKLRRELQTTEQWLYLLIKDKEDELVWYTLDPVSGHWRRLPHMPSDVATSPSKQSDAVSRSWVNLTGTHLTGLLRGIFWRRNSSEKSPFFGCSAAEVDGRLLVLGGFSNVAAAVSKVWKYDPATNSWSQAASMGTPRAYCKTGVIGKKLYAVGGVNKGRNGLTPLQSAEVYDMETDTWTPVPNMPFVGAQVLPTAFVTDILKPIATGIAAFRGKLWVPQSLYSWPFFMDVGGEVYDPVGDSWAEMPRGMGEGWPARQAGMKLSVVVNGCLYSVDPATCPDGSKIKLYDFEQDSWRIVVKRVPVLLDSSQDSEAPYLLCSLRTGLHIVTKDAHNKVTVFKGDVHKTAAPASSPSPDSVSDEWNIISTKNFGRVELVACQVLEL